MKKLLCVFFIIICGVLASGNKPERIYILHTNSSNGNLENCHCPGHPYGTLEKRAAFIDSVFKMGKEPIVVETGDFLSPLGNRFKDDYVIRCMEIIPYDAVLLGDQEFANGIGYFKKHLLKSDLPLTCYNLTIPDLNISPYKIVIREGIKIGIAGVIDPATFNLYEDSVRNSVSLKPLEEAIPALVKELSPKVDLIVLLSHSGYEKDQELAKKYPYLTVIVGGHSQTLIKKAEKHNRSIIVQAGRAGYYVGVLMLEMNSNKSIESYASEIFTLTLQMPDHPEVMKIIQDYKTAWKKKFRH